MKTILTRMFTVVVLMMISMAAGADVKVLYGKSGNDTFTGGKISARQEVQKDGQVAVTFTIKPDNGYTFTYTKTSLVIVSVYDPSSKSGTRADEVKVSETLSVKGSEGTIRYPNYGEYTVTVDPNLGVWVQTVVFTESGEKGDTPPANFLGMFYIANDSKNNNYYKGYDNAENFYLCPAQEYYDNETVSSDNTKPPFLTTIQHGQADESLWIVEKVTASGYTDYYTFKQKDGENYKYLTVNNALTGYKTHRRRVHLEVLTPSTLTDRNYFLIEKKKTNDGGIKGFAISCLDKYKPNNTRNKYLNPPSGNSNSYTSFNNQDEKPQSGGIVGFYLVEDKGALETGSVWFFEVPKPIIHIDENNKLKFSCANKYVTYHYTIDDDADPTADDTNVYDENEDIILSEGAHTIKVMAVMNTGDAVINTGDVHYASGVVTSKVLIFGTDSYLIQNVECTDYYMIPGDVSNDNTTVNTTSLFNPAMEWYCLDAAIDDTDGYQYYYIANKSTTSLLCYDGEICLRTYDSSSDNAFKFRKVPYPDTETPTGYNIIPYGVTSGNMYLHKPDGNNSNSAVSLSDSQSSPNSLWKFVQPSTIDTDAPFTVSDNSSTTYYKIKNGSDNTQYIAPPTTSGGNAIVSSTAGNWYFEEAQAATSDDWLTYYFIRNANTGEYLYYTGDNPHTDVASFEMRNTYDDTDEDRYMFTWARTVTADNYFIVPKMLKDETLGNISSLQGENSVLKIDATRDNTEAYWLFENSDVTVMSPLITYSADYSKFVITYTTAGASVRYTTNGTDPTESSTEYNAGTTGIALPGDVSIIKAIAVKESTTSAVTSFVAFRVSTAETEKPYIIQSMEHDWYYVIPCEAKDGYDRVTTTSLYRPSMMWQLKDAGIDDGRQYYYLYNKEEEKFLCFPAASTISVDTKANFDDATGSDKDKYKFYCEYQTTFGAYNIRPKSDPTVCVYKNGGNKTNYFVATTTWAHSREVGCWKFIPVFDGQMTSVTAPITVSSESTTSYYTIDNAAAIDYMIASTEGAAANAITKNTGGEESTWYFKQAATDNWLTYYYIVSAVDGKYLCFVDNSNITVQAFDNTSDDNFQFALAKSTELDDNDTPTKYAYFIVPKTVKYNNKNSYYSLWRDGTDETGNLKAKATRWYKINDTSNNEDNVIKWFFTADAGFQKSIGDGTVPARGITIDLSKSNDTYIVTVKHGEKTLVAGTSGTDYDYSVSEDDTDPKYHIITVTGANNYTGSAIAKYAVVSFHSDGSEGADGFATFVADADYALPEGMTAYIVTAISGNTITVEAVDYIPGPVAGSAPPVLIPVLLCFDDADALGFTLVARGTGDASGDDITEEQINSNMLKIASGTEEERTKAVATIYLLYNGEFVLNMAGVVPEGKVYLDPEAGSANAGSRPSFARLAIFGDQTNGISSIDNGKLTMDNGAGAWYDLSGRKLNDKPTVKGLYIRGGKKIVIK